MDLYRSKYSDKKKSGGRRRDDASRSFRNSRNDRDDFRRDDRYSRDRRESATVTCADCGDECEVPFVPRNNKPVYCSDCFRNNKPQDSGDRYSRDRREPRRDDRRESRRDDRYSRDRRESATVTCADCGDECEVPFVPKTDRPVYCSDCFRKNKPEDSGDDRSFRDNRREPRRDDRRESRRDDRYSRDRREPRRDNRRESGRDKPRKLNDRLSKKRESFFSNGSDKFYATIKEKLFEILGGKVCSSCGFKDERALGFSPVSENSSFDEIGRGGAASSWGKYISEPELAREELKVLCLNCNEINQPVAKPKEQKSRPKQKKSKYFPR
ncbi:CxxC-x17-CxxC domain-containing protein [Nitrosopumilus sp.]|uniref:CxxC-x17-CxxC domain-containing protein n=1 Tax=Nitrosopumilus sp. TaxID=2024843 RepID=UPI003D14D653